MNGRAAVLYFCDLFAYDYRVVLADLVLGVFLVVELAVVHVGVAVCAAEEAAASTAKTYSKQDAELPSFTIGNLLYFGLCH